MPGHTFARSMRDPFRLPGTPGTTSSVRKRVIQWFLMTLVSWTALFKAILRVRWPQVRGFHNRRPILGNADGYARICGVTCTELVLDVGAALASA